MTQLLGHRLPVHATANPLLQRELGEKLRKRGALAGMLGELEPMAIRLGLMQNSLKPTFRDPHLLIFAADHGIAVDGLRGPDGLATDVQVRRLLEGRLPVSVFARQQDMALTVVDAGVAEPVVRHEQLLVRKIAHGTRHARLGAAMTAEQMRAAVSAGVEIGAALPGNLAALAGIGVGGFESSAMVLARLTRAPVRELLLSGPRMNPDDLAHLLMIAQGVESRQRVSTDPLEVLAAFGGFEMAMMVGVMLATASRRGLIMVDGLQALAALAVASRLAPAIVDYCVFCRSHRHQGLDRAMALFKASAVLELGLDCTDGTGAALSWPLIRCAAALMSDVVDGEDPGPTLPQPLDVIEQL